MRQYLFALLLVSQGVAFAQSPVSARISSGLDVGLAIKSQYISPSLSYYQLLNFGPDKLFSIGYTAKFAVLYGDNLYYDTAPARLTRGKTGLEAIGAPLVPGNIDRVYFDYVTINSFNFGVRAQLHWKIIDVGGSADVLGLAFGRGRDGFYQSFKGKFVAGLGADGKDSLATFTGPNATQRASPANASLRLLGDNNLGTLATEVYARIHLNQRVAIKIGYQWLITEMKTTNTDVVADNNRFRNQTSMPYFAVTLPFFN